MRLDPALGLELPDESEYGRVLDGGDDDFVAVRVRSQACSDRRIVALRAAGGEQDLVGEGGADERGDLVAGRLHPLAARRAEARAPTRGCRSAR